jgi:ribosomal protein S18 acetylase RimI-like enzyme
MDAQERRLVGRGRQAPIEILIFKGAKDRGETLGTLRVTAPIWVLSRTVVGHGGVGEEDDRHGAHSSRPGAAPKGGLCRGRLRRYGEGMEGISIRPAAPGDAPALADLARKTYCETFVEGFAMGYPEADLRAFLDAAYAEAAVEQWIADPSGYLWVAARNGRLIGYVNAGDNSLPVSDPKPFDGELKRLYLSRDAQGLGLGKRLLDMGLEWLGPRRIFIGVWSGNAKAIALYHSRGFTEVGAYHFMVGSTPDDEVILGRDPALGDAEVADPGRFASPPATA